ncbi:hypothetical protein CXX84_15325 [Arthrobacter sp. AFG7.2]|nr:hypothetical protein CXX84_15325 [Arthrobacter sp. AFG7.2]
MTNLSPGSTSPTTGSFCGHCGSPQRKGTSDGGSPPPSDVLECGAHKEKADHQACAARLELEPPRYCTACGRRLKVQVSPHTWWASCSRHGSAC